MIPINADVVGSIYVELVFCTQTDSSHVFFEDKEMFVIDHNAHVTDAETGKQIGHFKIRFNERSQMLWDFFWTGGTEPVHIGTKTDAESLLKEEHAVACKIASGELVVPA